LCHLGKNIFLGHHRKTFVQRLTNICHISIDLSYFWAYYLFIMNNSLNENLYRTSDLALVTTLSLYSPIETTEPMDDRKVFFVFLKTPDLDMLIKKYWAGKLRVEPQRFFNQLKVIKTRIYSQI